MTHNPENSRRNFLKKLPVLGTLPFLSLEAIEKISTANNSIPDELQEFGNVIEPGSDPATWPEFRKKITEWRTAMQQKLNYNGSSYADPSFKWIQSNYVCGFIMMYDLEFYDPVKSEYKIDAFIERGKKDFGGYDSVVLWHAYPRIGIDDRNQFDFYRDMPGGLQGVRQVVDKFHSKNIKVFINYNPWDIGTKREGKPDIDALADIVKRIDADGIFLDTLKNASFDFRSKLDNIRKGIVVEGELAAELDVLSTHHLSWAQEFGDKYVPGILRNKWYERRHMQHQIARWTRDHSTELHQAWLNGSGIMIWENVFGQWLPWHDRDKAILRTISPIQHRYSEIFNGEGFTPLIEAKKEGVFANLWENEDIRIWTLVNRDEKKVSGELLTVPHITGNEYYDLVSGRIATTRKTGEEIMISGELSPRSIGCFLSMKKSDAGKDFNAFLSQMAVIKTKYSNETTLPFTKHELKKIKPLSTVAGYNVKEMVEIKPVTIRQFTSVENRECGTYYSQPVVAVNLSNSVVFDKTVHIPRMAVDIYPVTNEKFYEFIKATGYRPKESTNFLKHWKTNIFSEEKRNHPVVYVSLNDARAYAAWAGKRLPREEEWQFIAQGYSGPKYPWGNELEKNFYNSGKETTAVDAFPKGVSPFGCFDMCGNTWEMTESEYSDEHNRFCMLKGGSFYQAEGSHWYTRGGPLPSDVSTKFLMLYPGLDRCGTIGFRCVKDI